MMLAGVHAAGDAGDVVQEPLQHALAVRRVRHLGVELHPGQPLGEILERGHRRTRLLAVTVKPAGAARDAVAVAHPDGLPRGQAAEQRAAVAGELQLGPAELALAGVGHRAAEGLRHRLEAVADAEHRHAGLEERRVDLGRARLVHAGRTARQHDRRRVAGEHLGHRHRVRHDLGVDAGLPHPAGDQLGVLGTEVDDQDRTVSHGRAYRPAFMRSRSTDTGSLTDAQTAAIRGADCQRGAVSSWLPWLAW